ncbi:Histone acetyltransferase [Spironucleus salmonicida]|uniref:histone acetyltransferase n=1 Tax=Spironucleus salmonicida TaxID=348837 RepID=V6LMP8_9EUKA|nr:Histone acetyltransferase [Spironucleus salmonicida]|eukprot:EST45962.1 Histone methyltransferase MYST1 [Spironucleus salmonicida]
MSQSLLQVGSIVKARPLFQESALVNGTILMAKNNKYFIKFHNQDPRLSDWFTSSQVQFVSTPSPEFQKPQIYDIRNINYVIFGQYKIKCWYFSPYPPPYNELNEIFVCPRCLKYKKIEESANHIKYCIKAPVGVRIYQDKLISLYEVDGRFEKLFCQFLCLFSKMFLDSKMLYYNVDHFLFYVMTVNDEIVGYFSKEKLERNVLSCILTFPNYLQQGIGYHLIDFAYMLAKVENRIAGPEEPLSDLGEKSFFKYWKIKVLECIIQRSDEYFTSKKYPIKSNENSDSDNENDKKRKNDNRFYISLCDVSNETSILVKHVQQVIDLLPFRLKRGTDVGISQSLLHVLRGKLDELKAPKFNIQAHKIDMANLTWECYPCMFQGPRE